MTNRTEATMKNHRNLLLAVLVVAGTAAAACKDIETQNVPPKAVVEVLIGGKVVDTKMPIPYEGDPVELVLSGSKSEDEDGTITKYEWLRTDVPGSVRNGLVDGGAPFEGDPGSGAKATVVLEEGTYRFTLYVTDDDGVLGTPVSVSFSIETLLEYVGDPACMDTYEGANPECEACVCATAEMGGCFDLFDNCFNNADPMFSELCVAVLECGVANACTGAACYTPTFCMAQIDAAATYMGGAGTPECSDLANEAGDNPCRAINLFSSCINTEMFPDIDRVGCGKLCAP